MRVVCIDDKFNVEKGVSLLKKGQIYTVQDTANVQSEYYNGFRRVKGVYYKLVENGKWYHNSVFVPIVETEIDETTFERNYQKETA